MLRAGRLVPDLAELGLTMSPKYLVELLIRLMMALVAGAFVALVYRRTRARAEVSESFSVTLILLAILIAMVTQVIGESVARAFSLVGALSIVRFRTVVRDTQDTAYVIFSVAVGMAIGTSNPTVAVSGIAVVAVAAFAMRAKSRMTMSAPAGELPFELTVRLTSGVEPEAVLGPTLDRFRVSRQLMAVTTVKQGLAIEVIYRLAVDEGSLPAAVNALNTIDGVQGVTLRRIEQGE
jgi:hypothetical protein